MLAPSEFITAILGIFFIHPHSYNSINDLPQLEVLPNALDANYEGWNTGRHEEERYVFGYLGGPCHTRDVALLRGVNNSLDGNYMFRLFGYNGTEIYKFYAGILSGGDIGDNFGLFKGADIFTYPQFYNYMDCSLVPLEDNRFNRLKSELKLIEAGAFSKAVIVSGVEPYTNVITKKNCLVANSKADWIKHCKTLIDNPQLGIDLGGQLHEDTKIFDISEVNKERYKFYKDVQQKHNTSRSHELSGMVSVN